MDLIDLSRVTDQKATFDGFLHQVRDRFGFDHVAYLGANPVAGIMHGYVTYPEEWKQLYIACDFHLIDPTLTMAQRSIAPVSWERLEHNENFRKVFSKAREYDITSQGMTIPVRGPFGDTGLLSVTLDADATEWRKRISSSIGELQSVAVHMHDAVMNSDALSGILRRTQLSSRETEILQWIAAGKSQQDVADILGISIRTVEVHLRSAREKLYSLTTPQAVARAIALHLIYPL
ncbi:LuxR family transcriptional regulator [Pseudogemmobacter faecipullorum]|uniref:LuxR family transcriptional regulator n=1 Tax=Pseudogemmobacter faecipullorum TaxID=2755041 RepID=A0ABS8CHT5_9RHOB|nr:LuxR family transcriptional regulator [Pseudogemmobacter faecipullorum]MCB5408748.1 LuxR family transcriptional regulator [Pseudogemmobacter faecipullorum]